LYSKVIEGSDNMFDLSAAIAQVIFIGVVVIIGWAIFSLVKP
jgi:hypothetical protein